MSTELVVPKAMQALIGQQDIFAYFMHLDGKVYRDVTGRKTLQFVFDGQSYFIKQHFGVGWLEIIKNLLSLKKPILGALTEVNAIQRLDSLGILTTPLVAYGQRGSNPATLQSFVVTADLGEIISLEEYCADWKKQPPTPELKKAMILALARLAANLHGAGMCHRDFYLCHFVLKKTELAQGRINLYLIDLHRVLQHQNPHGNAVMKDIAGLMFSARDAGFDESDWALFKQHYLSQSSTFWIKARLRADKLYAKFHSRKFQARLAREKSGIQLLPK